MNGFLEVCECSETVYIFFCGKHNLAKGVYDLKNIVNGQLQYFIPLCFAYTMFGQSVKL